MNNMISLIFIEAFSWSDNEREMIEASKFDLSSLNASALTCSDTTLSSDEIQTEIIMCEPLHEWEKNTFHCCSYILNMNLDFNLNYCTQSRFIQ